MAEFEYTCVAGVHQCWRLQRDDKEIGDETDQLSDIEEAVADSIVDYCKQHSTTVASVRGGHGWRDFTTATGAVVQFRWSSTERDFRCHDCGYDTWDETYKVHDDVWSSAGQPDGRLCIGCIENRLRRMLTPDDFADDDLNTTAAQPRSMRLHDRQYGPRPARPKIDNTAPVGSIDLRAFQDCGDAFEIHACHACLPWYAEVVNDPETGETLVREWHAVECEAFQGPCQLV